MRMIVICSMTAGVWMPATGNPVHLRGIERWGAMDEQVRCSPRRDWSVGDGLGSTGTTFSVFVMAIHFMV